MQAVNVKQRSSYWDNMKGLLILLVVFAHVLDAWIQNFSVVRLVYSTIYVFHMPAFVFISGYFGKSEKSRGFQSILKLVLLYFIFNSAMGFIYGFENILQPMYVYWYLLALIVWRLTAYRIAKFRWIVWLLMGASLVAGFYPGIDNTFAIARIIGLYPYYMAGYLLSEAESQRFIERKHRVWLGIGGILGGVILSFIGYFYFQYAKQDLIYAVYRDPIALFGRMLLYGIAFLSIFWLRCITPNRNIPLLTKIGRNSLWIFILHRPLTLLISQYCELSSVWAMLGIAAISSFVLCWILGQDIVTKYMNAFIDNCVCIFTDEKPNKFGLSHLVLLMIAFGFIFNVTVQPFVSTTVDGNVIQDNQSDVLYPVMTDEKKQEFDNAFHIVFSGDLILLEDQVKRGWNGEAYDFSDVFEYAKPYIESADYAIGVFEGPMAGVEVGYSTSNYADGKEVRLNFPDQFATAVKDAGFDLVTTATNHVLDKDVAGAKRTLDVLDEIGLDHTGSYRDSEEKATQHIKFVECQGVKIAMLSYTYGSNYINTDRLISGDLSYVTSIIGDTKGDVFEALKKQVEEDFAVAKAASPDLIVVLPHVGTQFLNDADEEQRAWFEIFKENGADIILGDHPHTVQPAFIDEYNGKSVFMAYCPGNFANVYRQDQGDTSMLIDVYVDRNSKKVIGGGIVPLYTFSTMDGNFQAVPTYCIMQYKLPYLTTDDLVLADQANRLVTNVVFGHEMPISSVTEHYYFDESGFIRSKADAVVLTEKMRSGILWRAIENANKICFIGDSVTEGTKNGGCPWYEPIEAVMHGKEIINYSKGGCTVSYMVDRFDQIPDAELYVVALGTNDVRYRDHQLGAMTSQEFIIQIDQLKQMLAMKPSCKDIVFIAPWYSTDGDAVSRLSYKDKTKLNEEYSFALEEYCKGQNIGFINANGYIQEMLTLYPDQKFLLDWIHPNASAGVQLYSEAVLNQ